MSRNKTSRTPHRSASRLLLALALSALLFSGCAASRYVSKIPAAEARPIALLQPLSEISYIDRAGVQAYNDSLSAASTQLLTEIIMTLPLPQKSMEIPVDCVIPYDYSGENNVVTWDVAALSGVRPKLLKNAGVPDSITNLLRQNGYRYGMLVYASGFDRDAANYRKGLAGGIFLGVVTAVISSLVGFGGAAYSVPLRYLSQLYVMIVDVEANEIVYFANTANMEEECNPISPVAQRYRLERMFKRFK